MVPPVSQPDDETTPDAARKPRPTYLPWVAVVVVAALGLGLVLGIGWWRDRGPAPNDGPAPSSSRTTGTTTASALTARERTDLLAFGEKALPALLDRASGSRAARAAQERNARPYLSEAFRPDFTRAVAAAYAAYGEDASVSVRVDDLGIVAASDEVATLLAFPVQTVRSDDQSVRGRSSLVLTLLRDPAGDSWVVDGLDPSGRATQTERQTQRVAVLDAAGAFAAALAGFDAETTDAEIRRWQERTTGDLREEFPTLAQQARYALAASSARATATAVVDLNNRVATVLVATKGRERLSGQRRTEARDHQFRLRMQVVDGRWDVRRVDVLG